MNLFDRVVLNASLYGLPKIHKKDIPLRPILSITSSVLYQLAKYLSSLLHLSSLLQPVLSLYSSNCMHDFLSFPTSNLLNWTSSVFLRSFHISSLFANVFLAKTILITAGALYKMDHISALFHRKVSLNL